MKKYQVIFFAASFFSTNYGVLFAAPKKVPIEIIQKEKEIKGFKAPGEITYFWKASDICCDDDDNLYIADTGWNSIIKLTASGNFIQAFGRQGQGPGEFLAGASAGRLKISFGRDKNIYITDSGNQRISIFDCDGRFIRQLAIPRFLYDKAVADSEGRIFLLLANQDKKLGISVYSPENRLINSFFEMKLHFNAPFSEPPVEMKNVNDSEIQKHVTRDGKIVLLSNVSLKAFVYDGKTLKLEKIIQIDNERFLTDFKARLEAILRKSKRAYITPFESCLDQNDKLCLFYLNEKNNCSELYRYDLETGTLEDICIFPEQTKRRCCITRDGKIICIAQSDCINIYKLKRGG
jgi:hypothetical protein